jgi:hypothetical protein
MIAWNMVLMRIMLTDIRIGSPTIVCRRSMMVMI